MRDYYQSLFDAIQAAFEQKKKTGNQQLPPGVSGVEYWHPRNWTEWFHILREKVIVTIDGVPNKEHYQEAAKRSSLTLVDRAEALFEGGMLEGEIGYNIENRVDPVASVHYVPKMGTYHKVTIYHPHNIGLGATLLANYLTLERG